MNIDDPECDEIWNTLSKLNVDGFNITKESLDFEAEEDCEDKKISYYSEFPIIEKNKKRMKNDLDSELNIESESTKFIIDNFHSRCFIVKESYVNTNGTPLIKQLKMS